MLPNILLPFKCVVAQTHTLSKCFRGHCKIYFCPKWPPKVVLFWTCLHCLLFFDLLIASYCQDTSI